MPQPQQLVAQEQKVQQLVRLPPVHPAQWTNRGLHRQAQPPVRGGELVVQVPVVVGEAQFLAAPGPHRYKPG